MAAPKSRPSVSLVFDIDVEDPDTWCSVGLLTNTECHQKLLTSVSSIKSFCDLSEDEQHSISLRVGTDDIDTVCRHHQKFYHYYEHHKRGCVDPLNSHGSKKTTGDSVVVTEAMVEAAAGVVELEEGQRLCKMCVAGITSREESFASVLASPENQERCKTIDDLVSRCSVGLMTLTPCHLRDMTGLVGLRTLAAVPSRLAYSVASRLGRAFDSICLHHERVYCEGQGPDCFDPDGIHTGGQGLLPRALCTSLYLGLVRSLWLVPRRFALACRGNPVLRPGQTICLKCLDSIREKHPDVNSFYLADRTETQRKLARKKDPSVASEQHDGSDPYDSSAKESTDTAAKEEDAESSSATEDVDGIGRRQRRRNFATSDRQLRNLRVENPEFSEVLGQLDVKSKLREKRKVTKNISPLVASQ
ncbi:hypothetical protein HPB47_008757 [Ixodes persulcatus]|uniref:Uncharacterized protein n=1 Tax=Ixodes persulcatus TaxID=34615 RepID=A0AC60P3V7_IXOPE|nr:hypothetical protein HPB47_008757 [Ixodes persulcatus]